MFIFNSFPSVVFDSISNELFKDEKGEKSPRSKLFDTSTALCKSRNLSINFGDGSGISIDFSYVSLSDNSISTFLKLENRYPNGTGFTEIFSTNP